MSKRIRRGNQITLFKNLSLDKNKGPFVDFLDEHEYNTVTPLQMKRMIEDNKNLLIGLNKDEKRLLNKLVMETEKFRKRQKCFRVYGFAEHDCGDEEPEDDETEYYTAFWTPRGNKGDITATCIIYLDKITYQL